MQIVRIDVPNNIRNTYESSLLSQAYNSRFKVDRIMETCANLHFIPMSKRSRNDEEIGDCDRMVSCD